MTKVRIDSIGVGEEVILGGRFVSIRPDRRIAEPDNADNRAEDDQITESREQRSHGDAFRECVAT